MSERDDRREDRRYQDLVLVRRRRGWVSLANVQSRWLERLADRGTKA